MEVMMKKTILFLSISLFFGLFSGPTLAMEKNSLRKAKALDEKIAIEDLKHFVFEGKQISSLKNLNSETLRELKYELLIKFANHVVPILPTEYFHVYPYIKPKKGTVKIFDIRKSFKDRLIVEFSVTNFINKSETFKEKTFNTKTGKCTSTKDVVKKDFVASLEEEGRSKSLKGNKKYKIRKKEDIVWTTSSYAQGTYLEIWDISFLKKLSLEQFALCIVMGHEKEYRQSIINQKITRLSGASNEKKIQKLRKKIDSSNKHCFITKSNENVYKIFRSLPRPLQRNLESRGCVTLPLTKRAINFVKDHPVLTTIGIGVMVGVAYWLRNKSKS